MCSTMPRRAYGLMTTIGIRWAFDVVGTVLGVVLDHEDGR